MSSRASSYRALKPLLLPPRSPNLNAFAERFVGSVKSECLDRIVPLGEKHLRAAVRAFVDHYNDVSYCLAGRAAVRADCLQGVVPARRRRRCPRQNVTGTPMGPA